MSDTPSGILKRANISRPLDQRAFWHKLIHASAHACDLRFVLGVALLLSVPAIAQSQAATSAAESPGRIGRRTSTADLSIAGQQAQQQHKLLALLNAERQKSMVSDANKLLRLAREFNAEVTSGDSGLSPAQQAHKAAEIEKLAHNVREKMSFAVGMTLGLDSPFNASIP